jgi:urease accessory protein
MLVKEKLGNLGSSPGNSKQVDHMLVEWYETNKRILHKKTSGGREVTMKFLDQNPQLAPGDILYEDDSCIIVVDISEAEVIAIRPMNMQEMAAICYEIGNKHLPLFYQDEEILVAYEKPLFNFLQASGYQIEKAKRKLTQPLKTTVSPHGSNENTLFNRIMKLTTEAS